jgi:adenylate cyclase
MISVLCLVDASALASRTAGSGAATEEPELEAGAQWERLVRRLRSFGIDESTMQTSAAEGFAEFRRLVARHVAFPGARRYTPPELLERSGVDRETAQSLWRAMGFPVVPDDQPGFTDADVEALRIAVELLELTGNDRAIITQQTRSMGQAAARIAASQQNALGNLIPDEESLDAAEQALNVADDVLPRLDHLLVYIYRRHLAVAVEQRLSLRPTDAGAIPMSVGFADLTGFTALSSELDVEDLSTLIDRFNGATADLIAESGGRIVKTIGDEVMFATSDPGTLAAIGIALTNEISDANELPPLRAGLATGLVIGREGDVFGPPVNLASRLVTMAKPGSVLVDQQIREALREDDRFTFTALARRHIKGFGHIRTFRLRAAGDSPRRAR